MFATIQLSLSSVASLKTNIKLYKIIIFPVSCVAVKLGLTLRENHRLRVFENRVLRRIFGRKKEKVAGGWRRLHIEELHNFYV